MENISLMNSNLCCNALLKLRCWLILAKYGSSKLDVMKQVTQDAALDEFEIRVYLKKRFLDTTDTFSNFVRHVYGKTMTHITNYICSPDWSIFMGSGNDSIWLLKTVIENEIVTTASSFTFDSHDDCIRFFDSTKNEIFSVMDSWSNVTNTFSNYTNAALSYIFANRLKDLIIKYEDLPYSMDIRWLCEDILKSSQNPWPLQSMKPVEEKNCFWFVTETIGLHYFDDNDVSNDFYLQSEEELSQKLAEWLFNECVNEFRTNTKRVLNFEDETGARIYDRENLSRLLDMPISNLELHFNTSSDLCPEGFSVAEGPHYYVPNSLIELQSCLKESTNNQVIANDYESELQCEFQHSDIIQSDIMNLKENDQVLDVKIELEDFCMNTNEESKTNGTEVVKPNQIVVDYDGVPIPKIQIISRNEVSKYEGNKNAFPTKRRKRRGRPRKIDEFNNSKNSQHKYSQENVLDCSTWINDNFYEVAGNKPAIDRARLYELYTNYCLLKRCTPVDRALFGKIIRKVFPKLRSRRLIQNQVLKYHYVGLKPKFAELEQALLFADSSMNPTEIVLTYFPADN